jgi:hypothetical protein
MAIVDYTDVAAMGASLTGNVNIAPGTTNGAQPVVGPNGTDVLPVGFCASLLHVVVDTAFVSSTAAGLAMTVGDTGSATRYLASSQLQSGQTPITGAVGVIGNQPYRYAATDKISAFFTATTANLSTFTAGSMRLFFKLDDQSQLPKA